LSTPFAPWAAPFYALFLIGFIVVLIVLWELLCMGAKWVWSGFCDRMAQSERETAEVCMRASALAMVRMDFARQAEFAQASRMADAAADTWEARADKRKAVGRHA
jgi:hypothetical protein